MSRLLSRLVQQPLLWRGIVEKYCLRSTQAPQRILVAHHLLLGDTLMLAPLLSKLRQQFPEAEIIMTCPKALVGLFAGKPYGVKAIPYDPSDTSTLISLAKNRRFDLAYLPADNRMSWLARALGSRHTIGFDGDRPAYKNWFVDEFCTYPTMPTALPEIFASLTKGAPPAPFSPQDWCLPDCTPFNLPTTPYAVLHLGASSPLKFWPTARWQGLAQWLISKHITPVWSAGKNEMALVTQSDPEHLFASYAGKLDLLQMAHLLRGSKLLVCPDTGIAHLGRITDAPTITLFGPGSSTLCGKGEFWKNSPYLALTAEVACRDQSVLFKRSIAWVKRCARKKGSEDEQCSHAYCMEKITLEQVITACESFLFQDTTRKSQENYSS